MIEYSPLMSKPLGPETQSQNHYDLAASRFGQSAVCKLPPERILSYFQFSRSESIRKLCTDFWQGAKSFAEKAWKLGAVLGVAPMLSVSALTTPSALAVAVCAAHGAITGLFAGFALGAIIETTKSAIYLQKSPEARLDFAIQKGRERLEALKTKEINRRRLTTHELEDRATLNFHLPIWEGAARYIQQKKDSPGTVFSKIYVVDLDNPGFNFPDEQTKSGSRSTPLVTRLERPENRYYRTSLRIKSE